ncbi:MAG: DUF302 domain-containing protein [Acidimicrobiales bacterium]|nr:DUF302 domain-containing protein [Acidimicrobiales bacterium]
MTYTKTAALDLPFPEAVERVKKALSEQGFGILTEIDLQTTMKEKLDIDIEPYIILGACNPQLAHRALEADRSIGALLPCNVVVRNDGEKTVVDALDPSIMSSLSTGLDAVASDAGQLIDAAITDLSSEP